MVNDRKQYPHFKQLFGICWVKKLFRNYLVTVRVGLHPNAHVFMAEVPKIPTRTLEYQATMDEHGFSWVNVQTDEKTSAAEIIDDALEALGEFLEADLRYRAQRSG